MTDQLMDNLSNEEHEALLLMSEHGIAAPLSPAAQAVLDAFFASGWEDEPLHPNIAAALRAAADQSKNFYDPHEGKVSVVCVEKLLAIAAELDARQ